MVYWKQISDKGKLTGAIDYLYECILWLTNISSVLIWIQTRLTTISGLLIWIQTRLPKISGLLIWIQTRLTTISGY